MDTFNWEEDETQVYESELCYYRGIEAEVTKRPGKPGWSVIVKPTSEVCEVPELYSFDITDTKHEARVLAIRNLRQAAASYAHNRREEETA